jgi:hypothetical protein
MSSLDSAPARCELPAPPVGTISARAPYATAMSGGAEVSTLVPCPCRKLDSAIMVMKAAEDGRRCDATHMLDGAMDRMSLNSL